MKRSFSIFFILFSLVASLYGQSERGDYYFKLGDYPSAIKIYEKQLKKKDDVSSARNLALCYFKLRQYQRAEASYKSIIDKNNYNNDDLYNYGLVLKCNSNYQLAATQFERVMGSDKNNVEAARQYNFCKEQSIASNIDTVYSVTEVKKLNTGGNESNPFVTGNSLLYTSTVDANSLYENIPATFTIGIVKRNYKKSSDGQFDFDKSFTQQNVLNFNGNNGATSYSDSTKTIYFTHVSRNKSTKDTAKVNRPAIYFSVLKNSKWSKPQAFVWNNPEYSFEHPAISVDGKFLVFSSNMPGGFGAADLYYCENKDGAWTKPTNLGAEVNTSGNEVFPSLYKSKTLYFSSDGHAGFGGLDVYKTFFVMNKWQMPQNIGVPVNSAHDDFGVCFMGNDSIGMLSSNRTGGTGNDDIYMFKRIKKYETMRGRLFFADQSKANMNRKLVINDSYGNKVGETFTDAFGNFMFDKLNADEYYVVETDEPDNGFNGKMYLSDVKNRKVAIAAILKNKLQMKNLPADLTKLKELEEEDPPFYMGLTLLKDNATSTPVAGMSVKLVNTKGEVIQSSRTNTFGAYAFRKIAEKDTFFVVIDNGKTSVNNKEKYLLTNLDGELVQKSNIDKNGRVVFDFTGSNATKKNIARVDPSRLYKNFYGILYNQDNLPIKRTKVSIQDEGGTFFNECMTDDKGNFRFNKLPVDKNYLMGFDENDTALVLNTTKIIIRDTKQNKICEFDLIKYLKENYRLLDSDMNNLSEMEVSDPWLDLIDKKSAGGKDTVTILENLFYPVNGYEVSKEAQVILNKVMQVMKAKSDIFIEISSHTDSRGSDEYNLTLSNKRAKAAVDFMIKNGIPAKRLKSIGYGEKRLINKCANGVECSDEEHSKNRRTEFKVIY